MVEPRTEEAAEAASITIVMGGRPYRLPVLRIEQSEAWERAVAKGVSAMRTDLEDEDGEAAVHDLLSQGSIERRHSVVAYDHLSHADTYEREGCARCVLGGHDGIRKAMSKRELGNAVEVVADAEFPFDAEERRSVVAAFGLPLRVLGAVLRAATEGWSPQESSPNGRSPTGASATPPSDEIGPESSSSSDGPMASAASPERSRTARPRPR